MMFLRKLLFKRLQRFSKTITFCDDVRLLYFAISSCLNQTSYNFCKNIFVYIFLSYREARGQS